MMHVVPWQVTFGKIVLAPIAFPWVLEAAATSETRNVLVVVPWKN